ncbi:neuraminidase-like domain-containing protein [Aquimarina sp. AU474]|uniref:Tc toxin subunit A-related protein n=1 Tax=Aquimarina sp. AU474 TaxID=2108529 RepID=UPI000D68EFC3|nr:neuraminidase-like domain-containing protein [Aquimarina sp. AU474]
MKTTVNTKTTTRLNFFKADLGKEKIINEKFTSIYEESKGNWDKISVRLEKEPGFSKEMCEKLHFTHKISQWCDDREKLVERFQKDKKINSMRDVALNFNKEALVKVVKNTNAVIEAKTPKIIASELHTRLFHAQPTATIQRMLGDPKESPVSDKTRSGQLATFLSNQPQSFNIKTMSVYEAFKHENAFKDINSESAEEVVQEIKTLQRVVALSPVPEVLPVLIKSNMTSALRISDMPETQFIHTFSKDFGEDGELVAKQLHTNAVNARIRNEHALIALKEVGQGTGVDFIDRSLQKTSADDIKSVGAMASTSHATEGVVHRVLQDHHLSWDALFGDADFCECGECNSVYSAAAYFVELLQYLRNNNLDPHATGPTAIQPQDNHDISNTPLEKLFKRRPDLGCLQLTCKNTNTILPYIDLVNEVMENYIVHHHTKPFNVTDQTSGELLAQPQNTEYEAYCILHKAVYPFTLPYHQPIDVARVYLNHLDTSRTELIDTFRSVRKEKTEPVPDEGDPSTDSSITFTEEEEKELDDLHTTYIDRAVDAECLQLTQEEYVILTKEAFVTKEYWDKQCKKEHTDQEYLDKIGVKPIHEYYGYDTEAAMLDDAETSKVGLTFVKDQFLRRTGVSYVELVALLKTQCLNPNIPSGEALQIMQSIAFSYRFLQTLVDHSASNPKDKYKVLIEGLNKAQPLVPIYEELLNPDPCGPKADPCADNKDFEKWVYCYFERIGKIIVLENGVSCIDGEFTYHFSSDIGSLTLGIVRNCQIIFTDPTTGEESVIATIDKYTGLITIIDEDPGADYSTWTLFKFESSNGEKGKIIEVGDDLYLVSERRNLPFSVGKVDNCDLDTVRLIHLDGSPVTAQEYDHIHRFIRLWKKLGWTIDEVDKALIGLGDHQDDCMDDLLPGDADCISDCDDLFEDTEDCGESESNGDCFRAKDIQKIQCEITPNFLHQLIAVKKLLDVTGLELIKLLTFWTNISTAGEKSLYKRLFLKHNLKGIDKVFVEDKNGNYLTKQTKITEHMPVIMAAFNSSSDDIKAIMKVEGIEDILNISNLTMIYRYRLLSKVIGLKIPAFIRVLPVFGDPFIDAHTSLMFTDNWAKMEDTGFNYRQLNYVIKDDDDPKRPLAPSSQEILLLAKTLYDGLNAIDETHKDIKEEDELTIEMIRTKAVLLYPQELVEKIIGIIEGMNPFITNTPKNLTIEIAEGKTLKNKLRYNPEKGNIQITGILSQAETTDYNSLTNDPKWGEALERIEKQQSKLFKEVLFHVFETEKQKSPERKIEVEAAEVILKSGDILVPFEEINEGEEDPNTAPKKSRAFMNVFLPYLRDQLTHRFVVETLSQSIGLEEEETDVLISEILTAGNPKKPIYTIFEAIKESAKPVQTDWNGYLIPSAKNEYTFIIKDTDTVPVITLDGNMLSFAQQEDPTNEWWSDPIKLESGKLYTLHVSGKELNTVFWKTPTSSIENIPPSLLLPDFTTTMTEQAYILLYKTSILVSGFDIANFELKHFNEYPSDFGNIDFNAITFDHWLRLEAYIRLRNSLPKTATNLIEFFKWTHTPDDASKLSENMSTLTLWEKENIDILIHEDHFDMNKPEAFQNEINLLKLQKALEVADKIAMDIDLLFEWAKPTSNFKKTRKIADSIQHAIRAKYKQEDWEQVVKPLNDQIRNHQEDALIAYLLQQPDLIQWGVTDADGLFEYFLIDVQMDACMETSRIKQALSSVQLFVQRCFLGLEEVHSGITPDILDRERWKWMQRYRVWEANRKVFLYPENWIESNLRDDKTPFFKELESELLQNDITKENTEYVLKSYLYKVDEVANMEIVGLYIEGTKNVSDIWTEGSKLHVFARTRNAPYFYYYRYLTLDQMNWCPWEKMEVDIPSYDVVNSNNEIANNGCYLIPIAWQDRLLVFFPQFMKKVKPANDGSQTITDMANTSVANNKPKEYWEIKMGMSEYRNGKWTSKQLSKDTINFVDGSTLPDIERFEFIPSIHSSNKEFNIKISYKNSSTIIGKNSFKFSGTNLTTFSDSSTNNNDIEVVRFHHDNLGIIKSLQPQGAIKDEIDKYEFKDQNATTYNGGDNFYFADNHNLLSKLNSGNLTTFFGYNLNISNPDEAFGAYNHDNDLATHDVYHELKRPYSLYNWELFFHTPMILANTLSESQQFEDAMKWYHYVFNPTADGIDNKRFWQFRPFKEIDTKQILDSIFKNLEPNTSNQDITAWRNDPFKPHLIARSRPVAYMKWVVMKYIDNLIAWGDYLFRQDTIESINQATQLYVLAFHILGKRPQMIPKRGKIKPQTYNSLLHKWDAFSNAMVELEMAVPFSNQTSLPVGVESGVVGFANIFGFSSSLYFCIPNNPKLMRYWDTVEDRLFKIRHCLNIEGIFRKLPLFEPPIDPALLVKAAAQGLSIASVLNDLNTPMPNYRFYYLLQKSIELCNELKSLGGAMLSALEKKDGESLAYTRATHEGIMNSLIMEVRKKQLEEAESTIQNLMENRRLPEQRMKFYLKLIGETEDKVPNFETDFSPLENKIKIPESYSNVYVNTYEKVDMQKAKDAHDLQDTIGKIESMGSALSYIPDIEVNAKPLGLGGTIVFGGSQLGPATAAIARWMQTDAAEHSYASGKAAKKSGFLRAHQNRVLQANIAGLELKQIDKQILAQQIRVNIANQEISNQQKLIDNAKEVENFLRDKYTNEELYTWMKGNLKTVYHQVYSLAYELAKKAEKIYRFERGLSTSDFIQSGYWDSGRDGLLAGEQLYVGLKQLESAYHEKKTHDYEITKHVSLRQINPLSLIQLKETGICEFNLPEILFDMDYPGHYKRRIKSVSLSIPCIVGPYTGLNASLRLLEHKFRNSAIAKNKNDYKEKIEESDDRFMTFNIPVTAIAASSAQNESGMFELNFKDERYLPFEGAGAISKWRLELPDFRQFDYDTISDAIVHVRYTANEGGERMKKAAIDTVVDFNKNNEELGQQEGLFSIIDLKHDLSNEWYKAMQVNEGDAERILPIKNIIDFLPYYVRLDQNGKPREAKDIKLTDIILTTDSDLQASEIVIEQGDDEVNFTDGISVGETKTFAIRDEEIKADSMNVIIKNVDKEIKKALLVVRFILK